MAVGREGPEPNEGIQEKKGKEKGKKKIERARERLGGRPKQTQNVFLVYFFFFFCIYLFSPHEFESISRCFVRSKGLVQRRKKENEEDT